MKTTKLFKWIVIAAIIAIGFLVFANLSVKKEYSELNNLLADTVEQFEITITNQGTTINIQTQLIASHENAIAAGLIRESELKEKNLKQVEHIIRLENEIIMDDIIVDLPDSNLIVLTKPVLIDPGAYLKVPANFFYKEDWLSLNGVITGSSISVYDLRITTKPTIFIGYQKTGVFKPLRPVVTVEDLNPYVSTVRMQNVTIRQKPPFYKRPWWHRIEGAALVFGAQMLFNKF